MREFEFETDVGGAEFCLEVLEALQEQYGYSRDGALRWMNALWRGSRILASEGYAMNQGARKTAQMVNAYKLRHGPGRDRGAPVRGLVSVRELAAQLLEATSPKRVEVPSFLGATAPENLDDQLEAQGYFNHWNRVLNRLRTARFFLEEEFSDIELEVLRAFESSPHLRPVGVVASDDVGILVQGYVHDDEDPFLAAVYRCYLDGVSPLGWRTRMSDMTLSEAVAAAFGRED